MVPCGAGRTWVELCSRRGSPRSPCYPPASPRTVFSFELHWSTIAALQLSWGSLGCIPDTSRVAGPFLFATAKGVNVWDRKWLLKTLNDLPCIEQLLNFVVVVSEICPFPVGSSRHPLPPPLILAFTYGISLSLFLLCLFLGQGSERILKARIGGNWRAKLLTEGEVKGGSAPSPSNEGRSAWIHISRYLP